MKTWMMVKSGIRKNRSSSVTLVILIAFAALFLNTGMNVIGHLGSIVDEKNQSVNGADYLYVGKAACDQQAVSIMKKTEGFQSMEIEPAEYYSVTSLKNERVDEKETKVGMLFLNMDHDRKISKMRLIGAQGEPKEDSIVVPYSLKTSNGYQVGDVITITINEVKHQFHVYAFAEDVMFATTMNIDVYKCFISETVFEKIYESTKENEPQNAYFVRLKDGFSSDDYEQAVTKEFANAGSEALLKGLGLNYVTMKFGATATISIIMSIVIVFGALIILISLIVIHFSVSTYIEEDIKNLGSMEAIGFTGGMIRHALVMQFLAITMAGYLLGSVLSLALSDVVAPFVAVSIGLEWKQPISAEIFVLTLFILSGVIVAATYKISGRIKKVTPIMALRNGIETYHFGRNHMPLETSHGSLHWLLGMKGLLQNKKQNRSISIILCLLSFAIVFVAALYYSFVVNKSGLENIIGIEKSQLQVVDGSEDHESFFQQLNEVKGVKKTLRYKNMNLTMTNEGREVSCLVGICEDYSKVETDVLLEGRYPEHDNEIALSYRNAEKLNAALGDVISLTYGDGKQEYIVVGLVQHINNLGYSGRITEDGMRRCDPGYQSDVLLVYCEEGQDAEELEARMHDDVYQRGGSIVNMEESFDTMLASFYQGIALTCATISIIMAAVAALILFYLVKMRVNKERVHFGIQKAVGFTTSQLIFQMIAAFTPVAAVSSCVGGVAASLTSNVIVTGMLDLMTNMKNAGIQIPLVLLIACITTIIGLTIAVTAAVSLRIRKIEVRSLVEV